MSILGKFLVFSGSIGAATAFVMLLSALTGGCTSTKPHVAMACVDQYQQPVYIGLAKDMDSDTLVQHYVKYGILCMGFPEEVLDQAKSSPTPTHNPNHNRFQ